MKILISVLLSLCLVSMLASAQDASLQVVVKGLFKGAALLEINGQEKLLKAGKTSDEGVRLIDATSQQAVVEINGKRQTLGLSQSIGTRYKDSTRNEVRLTSQHQGHFFGSARINGRSVQFLVDTGATTVSMSSATAEKLGIQYKKGRVIRVATAQGTTNGFRITLPKVEVGSLSVSNVDAVIIEGEFPLDVLLGNSFLSQTDVNIEGGVLVLRSKF